MGASVELWEWQPITKIWLPKPAACTGIRMDGVGLVWGFPCYLHWILSNPQAANASATVSNTLAGGAVALDAFTATQDTHSVSMVPPMYFSVGIYLDTFVNLTSLMFGISD